MIDEREETGVARLEALPARDMRAGMAALAEMSNAEFEGRLAGLKRGTERVQRIHRELMRPEEDYGVIPGTQKPCLLKPGAERLCLFYGFVAEFRPEISYRDHEADDVPAIHVITECRLHLGDLDGPVVASGHGAANSFERKHRYRRGERHCPTCGMIGSIIRGKEELGGGWVCWSKKGGCGAKFSAGAPEIAEQIVGDIENPDPWDLQNTLVKMAEKRAFVTATLRATATSSLYGQDLEEMTPPAPEASRNAQEANLARSGAGLKEGKDTAPKPALKAAEQAKPADDGEAMTEKQRQGLRDLALDRGETGRNWLPAIETVQTKGEGRTLLEGLRRIPVVKAPEAEPEAAEGANDPFAGIAGEGAQ